MSIIHSFYVMIESIENLGGFLMTIYSLSAKNCMSHLLLKETFDQFSFIEAEFTTWGKFRLDGYLQEDFFDENQKRPTPAGKKPATFVSRSSAANAPR